MTETKDRAYSTHRIAAGAYAQVSNDRSRLLLVRQYDEDGSLTRWDGTVVVGKRWQVVEIRDTMIDGFDDEWRVIYRDADGLIEKFDPHLLREGMYETAGWDWDGPFDTKREAVAAAAEKTGNAAR